MRKQRNRPTKSSLTESAAILYNYFYPSSTSSVAAVDDDSAFDGDQHTGKTLGIGESRKSWNRLIERIKAASNDLRS